MNVGLYQAISGLKSAWEHQQIVATNLARSSVPGHRSAVAAFESEKIQPTSSNGQRITEPVNIQSWVDFKQGNLQPSGNPLNLAVQGDAFFSVRRSDGSVAYTRNGDFSRASDGRLTLPDGAELLMEGSTPVTLQGTDEMTVTVDGVVYQGSQRLGKLAMTHFINPSEDLKQGQDGKFELQEGHRFLDGMAATDRISQGYLEKSNTEPIEQMVRMIEISRAYEANQQMVRAQDESTGRLIKTVTG